MASVSFTLPAPNQSGAAFLGWNPLPDNTGFQIPASLLESALTAYLRTLLLTTGNTDTSRFSIHGTDTGSGATQGPEMSTAWELYSDAITLSQGSNSIVIPGPANSSNDLEDTGEPYASWRFSSSKRSELATFIGNFSTDATSTLTLDDGREEHEVDPADANWAFNVPQPQVTRMQQLSADAGDAAWAFATPQPTVLKTRTHAVNPGDAAWLFALPQPNVTHVPLGMHEVDPGDIAWAFEIPRPEVTLTQFISPAPESSPKVTLDLSGDVNLLIPQYDGSVRLRALVSALSELLQQQVVNPLLTMDRALNPDVSDGVLLDWIGARLGLTRPYVQSADATFFGFAGTETAGGRTFGQAPFWTPKAGIEQVEPLGDRSYRAMLKGRARRLRGGANRETIEAVASIIFGKGTSYLDETADPLEIVVDTEDVQLFGLVSDSFFELLIPRPAATEITMRRI